MTLIIPLSLSFLPLIFFLAYCAVSRKIPLFSAFCAILFGVFAIALASITQALFSPVTARFSGLQGVLFSSFVEAALIEELAKVFFVSLIPGIRKRNFSSRQILMLSLALAFSFSAFETLSYSIRSPSAFFLRALTALPVHAGATLAGGAWLASLYHDRGEDTLQGESAGPVALFICAIFLHGAFNACMSLSGYFLLPAIGCILALLAIAFHAWKKTDDFRKERFHS